MKSIYAITPSDVEFKRLIKEVERMLDFGVKVFQYREKNLSENLIMANAEKLLEMIKKNEGKLIINDDPKIAVEIGADGFHLGMEDYLKPKNLKFIKEHKEILNSDYLKGLTCKWNFELIKNLPEEHISWDYLGIGAFYQSKTKEEAEILKTDDKSYPLEISTKPLVAIGGINKTNMDEVFSLGYETIALSDGIFFQEDLRKIIKNLNF